jgi:hypothetical protein
MVLANLKYLFKLLNLFLGSYFQGLGFLSSAVLMIVKGTVQAKNGLMILTVDNVVIVPTLLEVR